MQIFIFDQKFCPRGGAARRPKFKKVNRQTSVNRIRSIDW